MVNQNMFSCRLSFKPIHGAEAAIEQCAGENGRVSSMVDYQNNINCYNML